MRFFVWLNKNNVYHNLAISMKYILNVKRTETNRTRIKVIVQRDSLYSDNLRDTYMTLRIYVNVICHSWHISCLCTDIKTASYCIHAYHGIFYEKIPLKRSRFGQSPLYHQQSLLRQGRGKMAEGGAGWGQHRYKFEYEKRVVPRGASRPTPLATL